jgi:hypothetical protein
MSLKVIIESNWNEIPITPLAKRLLEKWVNDEIRDSPDNKRKCLINQNKSINDLKPDELNLLLLKPNNIEILWVQKKNIGKKGGRIVFLFTYLCSIILLFFFIKRFPF